MSHNTSSKKVLLVLQFLLGISIVAIAIFAIGLALEIYTRSQGQAYYAAISLPQNTERRIEMPTSTPSPVPVPSINESGAIALSIEEEEEQYVPYVDFGALRESIPSAVAWIQSPGTNMNYPVVQWTDNDYFLSRLPDGTRHKIGSIFLDYRNSADFSDKSILLYGHNMKSDDIFGSLKNYANQSYYDEHSSIFIYTPEQDYELILFAGYILDSAVETPPMNFQDLVAFENFIADIKRRSIFESDVKVDAEDRLVFLCTCTTGARNDRLIIAGKLMEISF